MRSRCLARLLLALLLLWGPAACRSTTYDYGEGPVTASGRSAAPVDDRNPGDLEFETENPAVPAEEESYEDAVDDSER